MKVKGVKHSVGIARNAGVIASGTAADVSSFDPELDRLST